MDSVEHDYVVSPARTYLHVSFTRVQLFPVVLCVFRCRPVARLRFSQTITVKLSVVTLEHITKNIARMQTGTCHR